MKLAGGASALATAEDERFAAIERGAVNLLPEADEVVDCRDRRDENRKVDCGDGDPLDWDDEIAQLPLVPLVREYGGDHRDDLKHCLEFAEFAGLDGESF